MSDDDSALEQSWAANRKLRKQIEQQAAEIQQLREQVATIKAASQSVCDEVEKYRSMEARRLLGMPETGEK